MKQTLATMIRIMTILAGLVLLSDSASAGAAPVLDATRPEARTIVLNWSAGSPPADGWLVEYSETGVENDFTTLAYVPAATSSYIHGPLEPRKTFHYRVRPFRAARSQEISIKTGGEPADDAPHLSEGPFDETPGKDNSRSSLQDTRRHETAAPASVAVCFSSAERKNCVDLRWEDRADDEDHFLVEMRADDEQTYQVCAVLPPDTVSFRKTSLRPDTTYSFRVLAIAIGKPSNTAKNTTLLGPYAPQW